MAFKTRSTGSIEWMDASQNFVQYPKLTEFEEMFRDPDDHVPVKTKLQAAIKRRISSCNIRKSFLGLFPVIDTIKNYEINELPSDVIAGLTSGVMMIPQGMAFAALSTLPPIVGLYISFFASLTYFFLGTGRQLSWGCIAILSLMIASILDKFDSKMNGPQATECINGTIHAVGSAVYGIAVSASPSVTFTTTETLNVTNSDSSILHETSGADLDAVTRKRMEVASGVTFICGFILLIASRLGLSRITALMSNSLITGFTVGISFHVVTSQLKNLLGLSIVRFTGIAKVIKSWIEILKNLPDTNIASLIISVICMLVIYLVKKFINEKYKKKMRIPIPIELFVVIIATVVSNIAHLHQEYGVKVVEEVPVGIPAPKFPDISLVTEYVGDGLVIIIVAYAQTLAMAKTMGLKHHYVVDSNQEMLACGACSIVCGLFSGYITGASVSRSVVQDGAGGKTQIASLFAAGLVLLVIMVLGPYFYYLPTCVLSAIIVVNLRTMFLKLLEIPNEWRKSNYDCAVWVFTCVATVILNADVGLLAGVMFSLLLVLLRSMLTPVVEAGPIQTSALTAELRSIGRYSCAKKLQNVKIIKVKTPLYFINVDIFTCKVFSKANVNPVEVKKSSNEIMQKPTVPNGVCKITEPVMDSSFTEEQEQNEFVSKVKVIILDVAEVSFVDLMGVQALEFLIKEFSSVDVEVLITSTPEGILPIFKSTGFWQRHGDRLFLTVEGALASVAVAVNSAKEA